MLERSLYYYQCCVRLPIRVAVSSLCELEIEEVIQLPLGGKSLQPIVFCTQAVISILHWIRQFLILRHAWAVFYVIADTIHVSATAASAGTTIGG